MQKTADCRSFLCSTVKVGSHTTCVACCHVLYLILPFRCVLDRDCRSPETVKNPGLRAGGGAVRNTNVGKFLFMTKLVSFLLNLMKQVNYEHFRLGSSPGAERSRCHLHLLLLSKHTENLPRPAHVQRPPPVRYTTITTPTKYPGHEDQVGGRGYGILEGREREPGAEDGRPVHQLHLLGEPGTPSVTEPPLTYTASTNQCWCWWAERWTCGACPSSSP